MKVEMMVVVDDDSTDYEFKDLYIDENLIQGFFVPVDDDVDEPMVNILYPSMEVISVRATEQIKEVLRIKFVK